jgi:hypothetical protein
MKGKILAKDLRGNEPLKKNTNQLENTMLVRNTRRDIARVNTVLAERMRKSTAAPAPVTPAKEK